MKAKLVLILISLAMVVIPSLIAAAALSIFFNHFMVFLGLSIAVMFIVGEISNMWVQRKAEFEIMRIQNQLVEIKSQQSIEVSCAYCKDRNLVPIKLNIRNTFECKACKQTNLVVFQFATAQITTPLENPQLGTIPPQKHE